MKFGYARPCRWRVVYIVDDDPEKKEFLRVFSSHPALWTWMNQNEDKSIVRMSIMYEYDRCV